MKEKFATVCFAATVLFTGRLLRRGITIYIPMRVFVQNVKGGRGKGKQRKLATCFVEAWCEDEAVQL